MIQVGKRHIFVIVAHLASFFTYALRFNLSVTLVHMVYDDEFDWNEKEQGLLLSGFFHGYLSTLLLGAVVLSKWSAKNIFGVGILLSSLLTLVTPLAARTHFYMFYAVRFLLGKICSNSFLYVL